MEIPVEIEWYTVNWLGYKFHLDTLFYSWLAFLVILVFALLARRSIRTVPGKLGCLFEHIYAYFLDLASSMIHKQPERYVPFIMTIFLFVLACNWMGLIPTFIPPTRDYNTTLALALISFFAFNFYGIRRAMEDNKAAGKGVWGGFVTWISHFIQPVPEIWRSLEGPMKYILTPFLLVLFIILNIMEELMRILSLSVRLMGNILGEHLVLGVLLYLALFITQIWLRPMNWATSTFVCLLGALTGFIQAFVFAVLSLSYISGAVEGH